MAKNAFGGTWTDVKLEKFRKYLPAFTTALKKQSFKLVYIDAFAGSGVIDPKSTASENQELLIADSEEDSFKEGSARIALQIVPSFHKYVFIEKHKGKCDVLAQVKNEFPSYDIEIINDDCNSVIQNLCKKENWRSQRAVLFLDPFATAVEWSTLEAIGATGSIDTLILFPLSAINRMLPRSGEMPIEWENRLTTIFGTDEWKERFYSTISKADLFDEEIPEIQKIANTSVILGFFIERLKSVFRVVESKPMLLYNTRNSPIFALCFASGNPLALRIWESIRSKKDTRN